MTQTSAPSSRGVTIDKTHAKKVVGEIFSDYLANKKLFTYVRRSDAPQTKHCPEDIQKGSLKHAQWLFFAAMTDRREVSERVYAAHKQLWGKYESLLYTRPLLPLITTATDIVSFLIEEGIGMPDTSSKSWVACSSTLFGELRGNPTKLYEAGSIDAIVAQKDGAWHLPGFGPKLLSLLALFYHEVDLIQLPKDAFPVDVHVQRFALSTGIVTTKEKISSTALEKILRPLLSTICHEEDWPILEVAHALWFLGNRLCTGCSRNSESAFFCPAYAACKGPVNTWGYFKKGAWDQGDRYPRGGDRPFGISENTPLFDS